MHNVFKYKFDNFVYNKMAEFDDNESLGDERTDSLSNDEKNYYEDPSYTEEEE